MQPFKDPSGIQYPAKTGSGQSFISGLVPSQVVIITEVSDVYVKDEEN